MKLKIVNVIGYLFAVVTVCSCLCSCGIEQIDEGYRGVRKTWGKVEGDPLVPGLYFYNPISSSIIELDVMEHKLEGASSCFTGDTQKVDVSYAITYYPDPTKIGFLYSQFGKDWDKKIVLQVVLGSIKDVVGLYKADDLVGKREIARHAAEKELKDSLAMRHVIITKLDITNLDFDDGYEKAVEHKVIAIQKAAEAKNHTVEVEEKAKQTIRSAQADAEAMRIKSQALAQNKGLVEYEAIQKWNGQLPTYMFGSTVPMINLNGLK